MLPETQRWMQQSVLGGRVDFSWNISSVRVQVTPWKSRHHVSNNNCRELPHKLYFDYAEGLTLQYNKTAMISKACKVCREELRIALRMNFEKHLRKYKATRTHFSNSSSNAEEISLYRWVFRFSIDKALIFLTILQLKSFWHRRVAALWKNEHIKI